MDKNSNFSKQAGVTPVKLALIAVLAIVLLVVLYVQFGGDSSPSAPVATTPVVAPPASTRSSTRRSPSVDAIQELSAAASVAPKKAAQLANWQSPTLAQVVDYDPFSLPSAFPRPKVAAEAGAQAQDREAAIDASAQQAALEVKRNQLESTLQNLKQQGVQLIIKRDTQYVAIIGDKEIHVGDEIDGFRVIAIDAEGVRLAHDLSR